MTPVIRRVSGRGECGGEALEGGYEAYLALRCNVTSEVNPLGDFHPHAQWHHIKKENIGLIEVMGLAILPARLVDELGAVREHLLLGKLDELEHVAKDVAHLVTDDTLGVGSVEFRVTLGHLPRPCGMRRAPRVVLELVELA